MLHTELARKLGLDEEGNANLDHERLQQYVNLKLAAAGQPCHQGSCDAEFLEFTQALIENHQEKNRVLADYHCPADQRIQDFLDRYLADLGEPVPELPTSTFVLDRYGLARTLSLPPDRDEFVSDIVRSYRIKQGILHNPRSDRRTTKGVFHIADGGLPIPHDKKAVPKRTFSRILRVALTPPDDLLELPFTTSQDERARIMVSLLLRPTVCPAAGDGTPEKSMEIRFYAPGNLVSNLDFVESIFGNAGDPYLPRNDAALDCEGWTGHTGCVILAPHATRLKKRELGLPHVSEATERQKRDGMCWESEEEVYNEGTPFKITCRDEQGVIITVIADNYFGYSKKEVKTQISYSANLFGNCEEEHAGGALAFPSYVLGSEYTRFTQAFAATHTFVDMCHRYPDLVQVHPDGYGTDRNLPNIVYIPEDAALNLNAQRVTWEQQGQPREIKLLPGKTYIYPSGYKIEMRKHPSAPSWRLVGTVAEGTLCHKPSTVSGGGKSEISKSISHSILYGPFFVANFQADIERAAEIIHRDYSDRFKLEADYSVNPPRPVLSPQRSLGSLIKMLTPSVDFTPEYNQWLEGIPPHIKGLVYVIKRFYRPEWDDSWRDHFSVDTIDGNPGNELKFENRKLVASYLRVGIDADGNWRTYKLRQDFVAAHKLQMEDDITVSTVVPAGRIPGFEDGNGASVKLVENCEFRFFQRPDEAIFRGYDLQAEADLASPETFISNYEPLKRQDALELIDESIGFDQFSQPMKDLITDMSRTSTPEFFVSSAHPRLVDGQPTKNVRYLQKRPDVVDPSQKYVAQAGLRLYMKLPAEMPVRFPVNAVLPGRRNNPPEPGIRPLAVYSPIHYQELPELFMDFICSLTGKSPSTTGAGSEGALTKAPFNALLPITDMNNALVSWLLTNHHGFSTAAGFIGPKYRVGHDISLLIPEIWCRLTPQERDPHFMIRKGYLEKIEDFDHGGRSILASRLGYRITGKFVHTFFGRVFENPTAVFNEEMLRPESQDLEVFVDGVNNIVEAQKRVASSYFEDASVEVACPPLKALLHIMVHGHYKNQSIDCPEVRQMFTREALLSSDWYRQRLLSKQASDVALWQRHIRYLELFLTRSGYLRQASFLGVEQKLAGANETLRYVESSEYLDSLGGTLGRDTVFDHKTAKS